MNEQKLKGILGLSLRAGQAVLGEDVCSRLICSGRCAALFLDGEASGNTRRRYREMCERNSAEFVILPPGFIGAATGRDNMAIALREGAFAEQLKGCL